MKKKIILTAMIILGVMTTIGCGAKENKNESGKLRVAVTINPLKEFAEAIGGDKVEVFSIIPEGADVHDSEPMPKALKNLNDSDIFIYNGLNMEEWVDKILETIKDKDIEIVNASNGVNVIEIDKEDEHANESAEEHAAHENEHANETEEEHEGHDHGTQDPHVWLSLKEASKQAESIKNALVLKDEANKEYYEKNYENLKKEFDAIYEEYSEKFKTVTNKEFVTGHAAFAYLCRDFGLNQSSISDIYGEGELTPKNLENLAAYAKEKNVKTIFSESSASSSEAETLAREAGAKVEKIYSLETKVDDMSYLDGIKYNYETIYKALK